MNMIDITPIINAVIALAAAGVTVFLIPWIKSKTTDEQRKELLEWVIGNLNEPSADKTTVPASRFKNGGVTVLK